ncbi:hypothetical protein K3495_g754 [Podosphaera aphanis]|nr:hypothetical protein K3495_g754 [Podosphaera aphanis]
MTKRCKYWDRLNPIFSNRAASSPAFCADSESAVHTAGHITDQGSQNEERLSIAKGMDSHRDQVTVTVTVTVMGKRRIPLRKAGDKPATKKVTTSRADVSGPTLPSFEEVLKKMMYEMLESRIRLVELQHYQNIITPLSTFYASHMLRHSSQSNALDVSSNLGFVGSTSQHRPT